MPSAAVDRQRLWLPQSYKKHFSELRQAAELTEEKLPECVEIVDGSLWERDSTPEHPVFRFICRGEDRRTHSVLIDGVSLELLDERYPGGRISFDDLAVERERQEEERLRLEAEAKAEAERQRQRDYWADCQKQLAKKTARMKNLQWLTEQMPEPDLSIEGEVCFTADFDAIDIYGAPLRYRAECRYRSIEDFTIQIRPRR